MKYFRRYESFASLGLFTVGLFTVTDAILISQELLTIAVTVMSGGIYFSMWCG